MAVSSSEAVLESYIAENIVLQDCIEWFVFAGAYDMECVVLRIINEFFNSHFLAISRSKEVPVTQHLKFDLSDIS